MIVTGPCSHSRVHRLRGQVWTAHDPSPEMTIIYAEMLLLICLKCRGYIIVLSILRCYLQTQYPTRLLLPLRVANQHLAQSGPSTKYQAV
ncbi:hypothetical protein PILCRDRAFT_650784 [Piloderma croceum F 1598]|uniref:Uncharacterized protein n=1 Tax=Piloderma croceum (strain F 1598) TaxID=765440 RepID=A0A0C3F9B4_PILCF|nr:hypothetical protein PILCRDRAFT_650784 [Piloderma croceum F 1598]